MSNDKPARDPTDGTEREDAFGELARAGYAGVPGADGEHVARLSRLRARIGAPQADADPGRPDADVAGARVIRLRPGRRARARWTAAAAAVAVLVIAAVWLFDGAGPEAAPEVAAVTEAEPVLPEQDGMAVAKDTGPALGPPVRTPSEAAVAESSPRPSAPIAASDGGSRSTSVALGESAAARGSASADATVTVDGVPGKDPPPIAAAPAPGVPSAADAEGAFAKTSPALTEIDPPIGIASSTQTDTQAELGTAIVGEAPAARRQLADVGSDTADGLNVRADETSQTPAASAETLALSRSRISDLRRVTGAVTDDRGAPLPGALIEVERTGQRYVVGEDGGFDLSLPPEGRVALVTVPDSEDSLYVDLTRAERYDFEWPTEPSPDDVPQARPGGRDFVMPPLPPAAPRNAAFESYLDGADAGLTAPVELVFSVNKRGEPTRIRLGPSYEADRAAFRRAREVLEAGPAWGERWRRGRWRVVVR